MEPVGVAQSSSDKRRNLLLRLASVAVLLPVVIWMIVLGGLPFILLISVVATLCTQEVVAMSVGRMGAVECLVVLLAAATPFFTLQPGLYGRAVPTAGMLLVLIASGAAVIGGGDLALASGRLSKLIFAWVYGALLIAPLAVVRMYPSGGWWVVLTLTVTWFNDTGAYFTGHAFGRHKLHPQVSPAKTWEGFAGGLAGSIIGALGVRAIGFDDLALIDALIIGFVAGLVGPLGDLTESLLKRAYGVKDSGRILPGHGGMLDRVDALIFNVPVVYLYAVLVKGLPW